MQQLGAGVRRKSYAQPNPSMPSRQYSGEDGSGEDGLRTKHESYTIPSIQLQYFKRKKLLLQIDNHKNIKGNHYNTSKNKPNYFPHALTTRKKNNEKTLATMVSENDLKYDIISSARFISNLHNDSKNSQDGQATALNSARKQNQQEGQNQQKRNEEQELQGYTMGDKVEQAQSEDDDDKNRLQAKFKSFARQKPLQKDQYNCLPILESEQQLRMESRYWQIKQAQMRARKQDMDTLRHLNKYKMIKQKLNMESKRKSESMKLLNNLKRTSSLPKIRQKQQHRQHIIIPSYEELYGGQQDPQFADKRAKLKRIHGSMSCLRFAVGDSKDEHKRGVSNVGKWDELEREFEEVETIQKHLRSKGVKISAEVLKKGLLNIKNYNIYVGGTQNPAIYSQPHSLISNPLLRNK